MQFETNQERRPVVLAGLRTPFAKRGTVYRDLAAEELATECVSELMARGPLGPQQVQQVIFGRVGPSLQVDNIARQVALHASLPRNVDAFSVTSACATGYRAVTEAAQTVALGGTDCVVAGGADSASAAPMAVPGRVLTLLERLGKASQLSDVSALLSELDPQDLKPEVPSPKDPFSGLRMGDAGEQLAKRFGISREAQDEYAQRSHRLASRAFDSGDFADQVMTMYVPPNFDAVVHRDQHLRPDSTLEDYHRLSPVFDRSQGSLTAGNSAPLSDGAAAALIASAEFAAGEGLSKLGTIKACVFAATDPVQEMLLGPVFAAHQVLEEVGMTWDDLDLVDLHEAFAGQVLAVMGAIESDAFGRDRLGRSGRLGRISMDKFNIQGGSLAMGHPFAATGVRQIVQTLLALQERGGGTALCAACAAGGLASAMILEAEA